jgi:hypothetical protein
MTMKRRTQKSEVELLDTNEQLDLIGQLKLEAVRQGSVAREIFFLLFCLLGVVYLGLFLQFYLEPWWMVHQEIFQSSVPKYLFLLFYAISAEISVASSFVSLHGTQGGMKLFWVISICLSLTNLLFWIYIFISYDIISPYLFWMPLANLVCLFLAWYIDREMVALVSDVDILDNLVYKFNAA